MEEKEILKILEEIKQGISQILQTLEEIAEREDEWAEVESYDYPRSGKS